MKIIGTIHYVIGNVIHYFILIERIFNSSLS